MKSTSTPEQAILFYARKYIDPQAKNNSPYVEQYRADVSLTYNGQMYDIEYDSCSQHKDKFDKDIIRNAVFISHGYKVIRMRDVGLPFLPNCTNIELDFPNCSKKALIKVGNAIEELLAIFDIHEKIDVFQDIEEIKSMYQNY